MIKINLASQKRSTAVASGFGSADQIRISASQFTAIWAQLQEFPLKKIGSTVAVCVVATIIVNGYKDDLVKAAQAELEKVQAQKPKLEAETKKMKDLQDLQTSMETDEKKIRNKLDTIKKLMADRSSTVKVLEELTKITPAEVWLSTVAYKGGEINVKGFSPDFSRISDFTRNVQNSSMFQGMNLKDTQSVTDEQKREIASFSLTAKKR